MQNSINSDLIRGHIDTIILSILYVNDRYGYEILGEIDGKSGGQYKIKQPTLYSCLKRLESQGFIYSYRGDETESGGGRRKYYALTEMGKELFRKNQTNWEYSRSVIDKLVSDKAYQFLPFPSTAAGETESGGEQSGASLNVLSGQDIQTYLENKAHCEENAQDNAQSAGDYSSLNTATPDKTENIDEYFSNSESASYIDKVCGNDDAADLRSSFQIHNYTDDEDEPATDDKDKSEAVEPFYSDEDDEYSEYSKNNTDLSKDAFVNEYPDEQNKATAGITADSVSDGEHGGMTSDMDEKSGLFKSYNVNISEVEEYDSGISTAKKSGKSIMDMLEEASRARILSDSEKAAAELAQNSSSDNKSKQQFESDNDIVLNREYKNIIKQLLAGDENVFTGSASIAYRSNNSVSPAAVNESEKKIKARTVKESGGKQWRTEVNFDKVSDSVRSLGDDIKIRTYNSETDKEYTSMYYYLSNKLMLYQYGVLFILMLVEILAPFLIIKFGARIDSVSDIPILIISCLLAAVFPIYAVIQNFRNPNKKKRYNLDFKNSILFRMIVLVLLLVIIYLVNIVLKMDVTNPLHYLMGLIIPGLLATNVPVSLIIFRSMYHTQKFNTE